MARAPVQQLDAQTRFERRHRARDGGWRQVEATRTGREAFRLGHRHEHLHQMKPVHSFIPLRAIVNFKFYGFFFHSQ